MTLAPIRGAPPGAAIPDFPAEELNAGPAFATTAVPISDAPHRLPPARQPYTPVKFSGSGTTLTFRVIPEQPALSRASMTIHAIAEPVAQPSRAVGSLRMSADAARRFLADLRNGHAVARGDEDGTLEVAYEIGEFLLRDAGECHILCRFPCQHGREIEVAASHLLADLGT